MEIEKKYIVNTLPDKLDSYRCKSLEQAYISTSPVIRVRRSDDRYILTVKSKGLIEREEFELDMDRAEYESLVKKADGNVILKKRYIIPVTDTDGGCGDKDVDAGLKVELDIFEGDFKGLVYAEVEFPSLEWAEKFKVPSWFLRDVTGEGAYQNSALSTMDKADIPDFIEKTLR